MNIEISTKNTTLTDAMKEAVKDALQKAFKIQEKIIDVKVSIEHTNHKETPYEITGIIHDKLGNIIVTKKGVDVYKILKTLSEDLARQVRKQKEKHRDLAKEKVVG